MQGLELASLETALREYRLHGHPDAAPHIDWSSLTSAARPTSLQHQFDILSSLSNYHYKTGHRESRDHRHHVGYLQTLCAQHEGSRHLPYSTRNRVIYFALNDQWDKVRAELSKLTTADSSPATDLTEDNLQAPPKQRKYTERVVQVTTPMLMDHLNLPVAPSTECQVSALTTLYSNFKLVVVEHGDLVWRLHEPFRDVLLLNGYSAETGTFRPLEFCHVTVLHDGEEAYSICDCSVYRLLQQVVGDRENSDTIVAGTTCMHCRFVQEDVLPLSSRLWDPTQSASSSSFLEQKLAASLQHLSCAVVLIGPTSDATTTKFSVRGLDGSCELVHLSRGGTLISCQSGECAARMGGSKRSARRLLSLQEDRLCIHLEAMRANLEVWAPLTSTVEGEDGDELPPPSSTHLDTGSSFMVFLHSSFKLWYFGGIGQPFHLK